MISEISHTASTFMSVSVSATTTRRSLIVGPTNVRSAVPTRSFTQFYHHSHKHVLSPQRTVSHHRARKHRPASRVSTAAQKLFCTGAAPGYDNGHHVTLEKVITITGPYHTVDIRRSVFIIQYDTTTIHKLTMVRTSGYDLSYLISIRNSRHDSYILAHNIDGLDSISVYTTLPSGF